MERVVPVLPIDDYQRAVDCCVAGLGFSILMEHRHEPGFPVYMAIGRGELILGLSEHACGEPGAEVYIYVDDLAAWHARCVAHDIPVGDPPEPKPWGNTEMRLADPFRNTLRITQVDTHPRSNTPNRDEG
jgi:hypothetical protein